MGGIARAWPCVLLLGACQGAPPPAPAPAGPPAEVTVHFLTDPSTGRTEGPFDPETGRRVQTTVDAQGVLRAVLEPGTFRPVLLPPDPPR
jgi:hypothetical protein